MWTIKYYRNEFTLQINGNLLNILFSEFFRHIICYPVIVIVRVWLAMASFSLRVNDLISTVLADTVNKLGLKPPHSVTTCYFCYIMSIEYYSSIQMEIEISYKLCLDRSN